MSNSESDRSEHRSEASPRDGGVITRIEPQRRGATRLSVFVDGHFAFGLYAEVAEKAGLRVGDHLSADAREAILGEEEERRVYHRAMDFLAHRPRTVAEVRQRLDRDAVEPGVTGRVIERLLAMGYLDDRKYAEAFVSARLDAGGYGPERVRRELEGRGVDSALIDSVLETFDRDTDTLDLALRQARKRWPRLASEPDRLRRRKKLFDFLVRRGFSYDTARQAVDRVISEEDRGA